MGDENNPSGFQGDDLPVERISWNDTLEFLGKLNVLTRKKYRLLSESEWEYAARGGQKSQGYKYAGSNKLKDVGWYYDNSYGATKPVGLKYPNEFAISDMSGNVNEWVLPNFDNIPLNGSTLVDKSTEYSPCNLATAVGIVIRITAELHFPKKESMLG